jgi:hypothetical protein
VLELVVKADLVRSLEHLAPVGLEDGPAAAHAELGCGHLEIVPSIFVEQRVITPPRDRSDRRLGTPTGRAQAPAEGVSDQPSLLAEVPEPVRVQDDLDRRVDRARQPAP